MAEDVDSVEMVSDGDVHDVDRDDVNNSADISSSQPTLVLQPRRYRVDGSEDVSSNSDVQQMEDDEPCDCSSSSVVSAPRSSVLARPGSPQNECDASGQPFQQTHETSELCPSDSESEIVVDDSPSVVENPMEKVVSSFDENIEDMEIIVSGARHSMLNGADGGRRVLGRSRSVTPSPSYIRLATPSTPGTPRLRSGSVSGTTFAPISPKPSGSARNTPMERQRAGSMGEIELRDRMQGRVKIIDGLDILQLPRPRNPGGILPLNGHNHEPMNCSNEALNLIMEFKPKNKNDVTGSLPNASSSFVNFSMNASSQNNDSSSKKLNTSYMISNIIQTTPNNKKTASVSSFNTSAGANRRQGCAINESVERPKPSSIIDSEGLAKKIARLDSGGFPGARSTDSLWNTPTSSAQPVPHGVRVIGDKTPPERPKPPRRTVLSPADNGSLDLPTDRFVSSSARNRGNSRAPSASTDTNASSPNGDYDSMLSCAHQYHNRCNLCNGSTGKYSSNGNSARNSGGFRTFRCSQCDYNTTEKINYRRHRRLHQKASPVNLLKCVKCHFATPLSRKLRDHYQQAHPDLPASTLLPGLTSGHASPPALHGLPVGPSGSAAFGHTAEHYYDNSPLLMPRTDRLGYPFSVTGRHPPVNLPFGQYNVPYPGFRDRSSDPMASSYLHSMVNSILNSDMCTRQPAATSTVTSSSYYLQPSSSHLHDTHTCSTHGSCGNHGNHAACRHNASCSSHDTCGLHCPNLQSEVKVKIESDLDGLSSCVFNTGQLSRGLERRRLVSRSDDINTSVLNSSGTPNNSVTTNGTAAGRGSNSLTDSDLPTDLSSPLKQRRDTSGTSVRQSGPINLDNIDLDSSNDITSQGPGPNISSVSETIIKTDSTTRGVQCVLPLIKTEHDLDGDYYDYYSRTRCPGIERAVQCNLLNPSSMSGAALSSVAGTNRSQAFPASQGTCRSQSTSESDHSEHQSVCLESRCEHCGITFEDEVIFSIHIGCHSHTDPFRCNVCGKQCGNKYGFYSHIMRGHQA